jgi:hypothetical protein
MNLFPFVILLTILANDGGMSAKPWSRQITDCP